MFEAFFIVAAAFSAAWLVSVVLCHIITWSA